MFHFLNRTRARTAGSVALTAALVGAVGVTGIVVTAAPAAAAQPKPGHTALAPTTPRTDTPVISTGEIWDIEVAGNRVYVAGTFTSLANSAANGGNTVNQRYLAAYDINTGRIDTTFRPTFDKGVSAVEASPDGTSVYAAGQFNTVNGATKRKIVRMNPATGAPIAEFTANADSRATALAVSNTTVYVGGEFKSISKPGAAAISRRALVAVDRLTGAVDTAFNLPLSGGIGVNGSLTVQQLKLTHDDSKLLVVHTGRQIGGQDRYGVGLINTATKQLLPWRTRLWENYLPVVGGVQRVYGGDIAPNDQYFVVTSGSGGDRPPINDTAMAFPINGGDNVEPLWVSRHFDSVYSVAITENAVYVGGHFSFEESPTAQQPWPGLDNVGYGTGQGLSGYGLGDQVVRRDHIGALDPATGTALEWSPGSNSFEGNKAMEATSRGLFVGGDGMIQGGKRVGRVGFYDFSREPAASAIDTTITTPIEGRVVPANESFTITGTAKAPTAVNRVQIEILRGSQYLQDNLTSWGAANTINATLGAGGTTWQLQLPNGLTGTNAYKIQAKTFTSTGSDPVKATKRIESFSFGDQPPTTSISSPSSGVLTSTEFEVSGTATDDRGVNSLNMWVRQDGRYLQDDGSLGTYNTLRITPDVVGAANATWRYPLSLPSEGDWRIGVTAVDTAGQSDLREATRDWTINSTGVAPSVTITAPGVMTPPTAAQPIVVTPGSPITFSGTAVDDENLGLVEVSLSNSSTGERLAADGSWGRDVVGDYYRVSPLNLNANTFNWSYRTPFNLSPGQYNFVVRATDDTGLRTSSSYYGRLTVSAQVPNDLAPNGTLDFTGTDQNIEQLALNLTGAATDDKGVAGVEVSVYDNDTGRYVQRNGTMAASFAALDANLATPGAISTTFTLPVALPTEGDFSVAARAIDSVGQRDPSTSGATARYRVYPGDQDPALVPTLQSPAEGTAFTESRIVVTGRALDDNGISRVEVQVADSAGLTMNSSGTFATGDRWVSAFLTSPGTPGSNYSYTTPAIASGAYVVRVRATDDHGQVQATPSAANVTVSAPAGNAAPVARATVTCTKNVCAFDGRTSTDESPASLTYAWNFGNGRTASGPVPSQTFTAAGAYTVTLTVKDYYGVVGTTTLPVTITEPDTNVAPTAVLNPPACTGLVCSFSAVGSADSNVGDVLTYTWDFGDGGTATSGSSQTKTYLAGGTYTVRVTVADGWGRSTSATRTVTISP